MFGTDPGKRLRSVALAAVLLAACAAAAASESTSSTEPESASWVPKELSFTYQGVTTRYTCDSLRYKMRDILLELGARPDLVIRTWGCARPVGPEIFPGVAVHMNVLAPGPDGQPKVAAHWKRVDLANHSTVDPGVDCELISQIKLKVLPLFPTRNVDYNAPCVRGQLFPGTTRLTADVLVADPGAATASR